MNLSKRERIFSLLCLIMLGLLVLDSVVITPAVESYKSDLQLRSDLADSARDDEFLYSRSDIISDSWQKRLDAGLSQRADQAESALLSAIESWASESGLEITSMRSSRGQMGKIFDQAICNLSAKADMNSLREFLYLSHAAELPVKVSEVKIVCSDNASAEMSVQMHISTITLTVQKGDK